MSDPIVTDNKPQRVQLEASESYHWCACGQSGNQPYCDGSHAGTGISPRSFQGEGEAFVCMCRQTGNPPF
ncbi:MAG: CDGSH iron-sulfur domain-containing protein, partial [Planctomycetota bacterium]